MPCLCDIEAGLFQITHTFHIDIHMTPMLFFANFCIIYLSFRFILYTILHNSSKNQVYIIVFFKWFM